MTGKIKRFGSVRPSSLISTLNRRDVPIDRSAGEPPAAGLAADQPAAAEFSPAGGHLQYMGFDQTGGTRAYRFRLLWHGVETREFTVTADMALFAAHHVGIQEGPGLALRLLSAAMEYSVLSDGPASRPLSDVDLIEHLARRAALTPERSRKRGLATRSTGPFLPDVRRPDAL